MHDGSDNYYREEIEISFFSYLIMDFLSSNACFLMSSTPRTTREKSLRLNV